ncbi:hypothetical protein NPIL_286371 [Nephila pilipes]|uniref:Uncharacterized protein n=1 Tax=Nephila pilipes TaxID=299642 RepID=A0A8X6UTV1_NEPPI|nr:hypothetical protein NPIL_286371 [Nephila pilipes]
MIRRYGMRSSTCSVLRGLPYCVVRDRRHLRQSGGDLFLSDWADEPRFMTIYQFYHDSLWWSGYDRMDLPWLAYHERVEKEFLASRCKPGTCSGINNDWTSGQSPLSADVTFQRHMVPSRLGLLF